MIFLNLTEIISWLLLKLDQVEVLNCKIQERRKNFKGILSQNEFLICLTDFMLILKHIFVFSWRHSNTLKLTKYKKLVMLGTLSVSLAPELVFHLVSPAPELIFYLASPAPEAEPVTPNERLVLEPVTLIECWVLQWFLYVG